MPKKKDISPRVFTVNDLITFAAIHARHGKEITKKDVKFYANQIYGWEAMKKMLYDNKDFNDLD